MTWKQVPHFIMGWRSVGKYAQKQITDVTLIPFLAADDWKKSTLLLHYGKAFCLNQVKWRGLSILLKNSKSSSLKLLPSSNCEFSLKLLLSGNFRAFFGHFILSGMPFLNHFENEAICVRNLSWCLRARSWMTPPTNPDNLIHPIYTKMSWITKIGIDCGQYLAFSKRMREETIRRN